MRQRDNWYIYSRDLNCTICWPLIGKSRIFQASSSLHECQKDAGAITKVAFVANFLLELIENFSAMLAFLSYHTLGFTIAATLVCFNSCSFWLCQYSLCTIFLSGNIFSKKIATKLYSGNQPCVRCIHNQDEHCSKEFFARRLPQPN